MVNKESTNNEPLQNEEVQQPENNNEAVENQEQETAQQEESQESNGTAQTEDVAAKLQAANDKYLRLAAEFDNYRRRTVKERGELIKTAGEDILIQLLPVIDNFERGLKSLEDAKDLEAVKLGVELIYTNFKEFLNNKGVKEIEAVNQEFDTDKHEALTKIPVTDENQKGKVVDVIQKGYFLYDKVIRYSKVVVGD